MGSPSLRGYECRSGMSTSKIQFGVQSYDLLVTLLCQLTTAAT
jgi:hypothetical protein